MNIFLTEISQNYVLATAAVSWFIAQLIKFLTAIVREKKFSPLLLVSSGGMPSSHTSFVVALSTMVGLQQGFNSAVFAISLVFSSVVMYDATGVRRHAGKQAQVLNMLVENLNNPNISLEKKLKELLGHTPKQVLAGAILGIVVAIVSAIRHGYIPM